MDKQKLNNSIKKAKELLESGNFREALREAEVLLMSFRSILLNKLTVRTAC